MMKTMQFWAIVDRSSDPPEVLHSTLATTQLMTLRLFHNLIGNTLTLDGAVKNGASIESVTLTFDAAPRSPGGSE